MRVCLFCYTRSFIPHSRLLLPPETPTRYSLRSFIFYTGVSRRLLLCSPAGRCGLIGLSQFLWSLPCGFCRVRSVIPQATFLHSHRNATTRKSCPSIVRFIPFHYLIPSSPCLFQRTRSRNKKLRQPCRIRQPSAALILRAVCCQRPCSTRSRLAPLHYAGKKTTPLSLRLFFTCSVPAQGCFTCSRFKSCFARTQPPTTHP